MMTKKANWLTQDMSKRQLHTTRVVTMLCGMLALISVLLGALVPRVGAWVSGAPLVFTAGSDRPGPVVEEALRPGASARWTGQVEYTVTNPTVLQRVGDLIGPLALFVLLVLGFGLVWRLLGRVASGDPFREDAMRTFRALSSLLAVGAICLPVVALVGRMFALVDSQESPHVFAHATPEDLAIALTGLAAAGLVELLGLVFRRGTQLRQDAEGLV